MSIRIKIWSLISLFLLAAIFLLTFGTHYILRDRFAALEKSYIEKDNLRIYDAVFREEDSLGRSLSEWARSGNRCDKIFTAGSEAKYLNVMALGDLRADFMALASRSGRVQKILEIDRVENTVRAPAFLSEDIQGIYPSLFKADKPGEILRGIVTLNNRQAFVAAYPVQRSRSNPGGTIIVGRYLDGDMIQRLSRLSDLPLEVQKSRSAAMPKVGIVTPIDSNKIAGEISFLDINDYPAFSLRFIKSREIYLQGLSSTRYLTVILLCVGLVFGLSSLAVFEKTVLRRLSWLDRDMHNIGINGVLSDRLPFTGNKHSDEFDRLTRSINAMLETLETSCSKAEETLRENEALYRGIFESIQDVYFRTDMKGFFTLVSPSVKTVTGYEPAQVIGRSIRDFEVPPSRFKRYTRLLLKNRSAQNYELNIRCREGESMVVTINAQLLFDEEGNACAIEGTMRDVTAYKRAEERERELLHLMENERLRSEFLAVVSHELKTPLTPIIAGTELLKSGDICPMNERAMKILEMADRQSKRLLRLINDLLDLFQIESGFLTLHLEEIYLSKLLVEIVEDYKIPFQEKGLTLELTCEEMPCIMGDNERIEHIFENLLENSLKCTAQGGVTIKGGCEGGNIRIDVIDTGVGIASQHLNYIFHSFYQVDKNKPGAGLGLSIVKQLVEAHNGAIKVSSVPGQGSTFTIFFPIARAQEVTV